MRGFDFSIETEKTINGPRLENAKALISLSQEKGNHVIQRRIAGAVLRYPGIKIGALLTAIAAQDGDEQSYKKELLHMLFKNTINTNPSLPITDESELWSFKRNT